MANTTVSILIRFKDGGRRRTVAAAYAGKARLKPGIGRDKKGREFLCPGGIYWLRWYDGPKQEWRRVGPDAHDALTAQMRQEDRLAGVPVPKEQSTPTHRATLAESTEEFVRERRDMNPDSVDRWEKELALFQRLASSKTYLDELGRSDVFAYRKWYKDHGRSDNTVALRTSSLLTFGKRFGVLYDLFTKEERDDLTERSEGPVDYYTENDPEELKKFFAACDAEERLRFMFFLHTGAREKEVQYAMFRNLDLVHRTFRIEAKDYKGKKRKTKNRKSRTVPIPLVLADALTTWRAICGTAS